MSEAISVAAEREGETLRLIAEGELDLNTVGVLETAIGQPAPGELCLLDLRGLAFMDSTGINLFMRLDIRARAEGWRLAIVRGPGIVGRVLDMCRMGDRITLVDDPVDVM